METKTRKRSPQKRAKQNKTRGGTKPNRPKHTVLKQEPPGQQAPKKHKEEEQAKPTHHPPIT